ncbi:MAG: DUF2089 domain-containing protein [Armatimonadetes bacterium]|nr:DUF2089 domain-containing protein [Armatimonadota bacterium]
MPHAPGKCPVCGQDLEVVRLQCTSCRTSVEGHFELSRFSRLDPEQLAFLELFLKARGNLKDVERELGLSYPTVRNRLEAVLAALGFAAEPTQKVEAGRRRREILDALDAGKIGAEEALRLLRDRK